MSKDEAIQQLQAIIDKVFSRNESSVLNDDILTKFHEALQIILQEDAKLPLCLKRTDQKHKTEETFHPLFYAMWRAAKFKLHTTKSSRPRSGTLPQFKNKIENSILTELMKHSKPSDLSSSSADKFPKLAYYIMKFQIVSRFIETKCPGGNLTKDFFFELVDDLEVHMFLFGENFLDQIVALVKLEEINLDVFNDILKKIPQDAHQFFAGRFLYQVSAMGGTSSASSLINEKIEIILFWYIASNSRLYSLWDIIGKYADHLVLSAREESRKTVFIRMIQRAMPPFQPNKISNGIVQLAKHLFRRGQQLGYILPEAQEPYANIAPIHITTLVEHDLAFQQLQRTVAHLDAVQQAPVLEQVLDPHANRQIVFQANPRQNIPTLILPQLTFPRPTQIDMALTALIKKTVALVFFHDHKLDGFFVNMPNQFILRKFLEVELIGLLNKPEVSQELQAFYERWGSATIQQGEALCYQVQRYFFKDLTPIMPLVKKIQNELSQNYLEKKFKHYLKEIVDYNCEREQRFNNWRFKFLSLVLSNPNFRVENDYYFWSHRDIDFFGWMQKLLLGKTKFHDFPLIEILGPLGHKNVAKSLWDHPEIANFLLTDVPQNVKTDSNKFQQLKDFALHCFQYHKILISHAEYQEMVKLYLLRETNNLAALVFKIKYWEDPDFLNENQKNLLSAYCSVENLQSLQTADHWEYWFFGVDAEIFLDADFEDAQLQQIKLHLLCSVVEYVIEKLKQSPSDFSLLINPIDLILKEGGEVDLQILGRTVLSETWRVGYHALFIKLINASANIVTAALLLSDSQRGFRRILFEMVNYVIEQNDKHLNTIVLVHLIETEAHLEDFDQFFCLLMDGGIDLLQEVPSTLREYLDETSTPLLSLALLGQARFCTDLINEFGPIDMDYEARIQRAIYGYPFLTVAQRTELYLSLQEANMHKLQDTQRKQSVDVLGESEGSVVESRKRPLSSTFALFRENEPSKRSKSDESAEFSVLTP